MNGSVELPEQAHLWIQGESVYCPRFGSLRSAGVAVRNGKISAVGGVPSDAVTLDFPHATIFPGWIDLHAHPSHGGSKFSVDPDQYMLSRGVTTVMSQGDAGADNWREYREQTIGRSHTRVRIALNLARDGETRDGGCYSQPEFVDAERCGIIARQYHGEIWGVSVNLSETSCGRTDPHWVLQQALRAAELGECPLLVGLRRPDQWPLEDQLARLRPGDVVTYCFRPLPCCLLQDGRPHPAVVEARQRGVLFDVGHGTQSFSFAVAERMIGAGFPPDTISTDLWRNHLGQQPPHDLPRTFSKLVATGMPFPEAVRAVTARPAEILGLAGEIGTLQLGSCADLTVLAQSPEPELLRDTCGETRRGYRWEPVAVFRAGRRHSVVREK